MVRRLILAALMLLLIAQGAGSAAASTAIFYQPQRGDRMLPAADWPAIFARARSMGFDTLVVQWVAYGDAFDTPVAQDWLQQRLRDARAARLGLVLGLGGDPDFFKRQEAPLAELRVYLRQLADHDVALARSWSGRLGASAIDGWYLPMEIDDVRWRAADARALLLAHLRDEVASLHDVLPRPVYVSTFFAGHMKPDAYARLVADIESTGARVWVQDGAGTGRLLPVERALYMDPLSQCNPPRIGGVVHELFVQTAHDASFAARPAAADEVHRALASKAPCGGDSVFFGLRYLPGMDALREPARAAAGAGTPQTAGPSP